MKIETLMENATPDERNIIAQVALRAAERPAIVVTLDEYGKRRKYVVAEEDEIYFDGITVEKIQSELWLYRSRNFGGQWLRGFGRVDEMYRSALNFDKIVKIERLDRRKVWGGR